MAKLLPVDGGQLLRQLAADLGRPPTPSEGVTLALALRVIAQGVNEATHGDHPAHPSQAAREAGHAVISSLELRQLAIHLSSTVGLAVEASGPPSVVLADAEALPLCAAMLRIGAEQHRPRVVQCMYHAGHERLYLHKYQDAEGVEVTWSDSHPNVIGF